MPVPMPLLNLIGRNRNPRYRLEAVMREEKWLKAELKELGSALIKGEIGKDEYDRAAMKITRKLGGMHGKKVELHGLLAHTKGPRGNVPI